MQTVELLEQAAARYGERPFLMAEEGNVSFAEVDRLSNRLANSLKRLGIGKGDNVALYLDGCVEFVVCRFAIQKLGALAVLVNTRLVAPEIEHILTNSESRLLIAGGEFLPTIDKIPLVDLKGRVVVVGAQAGDEGHLTYTDLIREGGNGRPQVELDAEDDALILYTSGTTGRPKGAVIRHSNTLASGRWMAKATGLSGSDVLLSCIPMFAASSLNGYLVASLLNGTPWVLTRKFSPADVLDKLEQHRVTVVHAAGPQHVILVNHESFPQRHLTSLRLLTWSNLLPLAVLEKMRQGLPGVSMIQFYGMTETSPMGSHISNEDMLARPTSCGKPDAEFCQVRVVDSAGRDVPVGETGEIIYRGSGLMRAYYKNPQGTAEAVRDGWFYTGDLARVDEKGFLYIVGRTKDMINRGGHKVYAAEVEEVLYTHPAVLEAAVVGFPHEVLGEEVKAHIVLKPGQQATAAEMMAHCQDKLAAYKIPKVVEFRSEFPKNSMGKILKYVLVERCR